MKTGPYRMSHSAKSISTKLIQGENENGNVDSTIPPINPIYGNKRLPPHNLDKYPREQTREPYNEELPLTIPPFQGNNHSC